MRNSIFPTHTLYLSQSTYISRICSIHTTFKVSFIFHKNTDLGMREGMNKCCVYTMSIVHTHDLEQLMVIICIFLCRSLNFIIHHIDMISPVFLCLSISISFTFSSFLLLILELLFK